jgi:hypothetical protein
MPKKPTGIATAKDDHPLKLEFEEFKVLLVAELDGFEHDLDGFSIDSQEDLQLIADVTATCKGHEKKLKALQTAMLAPIKKQDTETRDLFRDVSGRLTKLEGSLKAKIGSYDLRQRVERERALKEAEQAARAGNATRTEAALARAESSQAEAVKGLSVRYTIDIEILDESIVPSEWFTIDEARIGKYVRATNGEVPIPGVAYHKRPIVASSSR